MLTENEKSSSFIGIANLRGSTLRSMCLSQRPVTIDVFGTDVVLENACLGDMTRAGAQEKVPAV